MISSREIDRIAYQEGLTRKQVLLIYTAYWKAVRRKLMSYRFEPGMSREDFESQSPVVCIKYLGKFVADYGYFNKKNNGIYKNKKDQTDVYCTGHNKG